MARNQQIDDVDGRKWGIRGVGGAQAIEWTNEIQADVELVDDRRHQEIYYRFGANRISELDHSVLHLVTPVVEEQLAARNIGSAQNDRLRRRSPHAQVSGPLKTHLAASQTHFPRRA